MTLGGETCTAESSKTKRGSLGPPTLVLSHSIKVDAYVDSLVDGLQIANRYFHSRCGRCWYGRRPWNGIGGSPVCRRVRGRGVGVVNVGGRVTVTKPRGVTRHRANWGGLGCIILDGIQLSRLRLRGPGGRRGTGGHMDIVLIKRCVHLSERQRSGLPLWGRVDNP
jgi:hypothetical protein